MADTPQEVLDAVARDGEGVMVHVAEDAAAIAFEDAIKLGYTVIRLAVND